MTPVVNEYDLEPIPGLPEVPPQGEVILWQGAPRWTGLARHAFHVVKVALYFALILAWVFAASLMAGEPLAEAARLGAWLLALALVALGLLLLLAWANSRVSLYTITNRRVVMRFGVAVSMTINLPFSKIACADLRRYSDGSGDIPLRLVGQQRVSYLVLWPHVRPWSFGQVQPMLRAVAEAEGVAKILVDALKQMNSPVTAPSTLTPVAGQDQGEQSKPSIAVMQSP